MFVYRIKACSLTSFLNLFDGLALTTQPKMNDICYETAKITERKFAEKCGFQTMSLLNLKTIYGTKCKNKSKQPECFYVNNKKWI